VGGIVGFLHGYLFGDSMSAVRGQSEDHGAVYDTADSEACGNGI
jgi:hypothetical protein